MALCTKVRYPSKEFADNALASLKARSDEHPARAARLEAYFHRLCGTWHIGHSLPLKVRRRGRYAK